MGASHRLPATTAQRINAERVVLFGWSRAILLQLAHPLVAAGVAEYSSFRGGTRAIAARLHHTVGAMLALTFGTPAECEAALEGIRAIHRRVNGRLAQTVGPFPAGTPYNAEDPELVLWVHLTLLDSTVLVYEHLIAPLTEADRDTYCREAAWSAVALGAREAEVPRTWRALGDQLAVSYASGRIAVGAQARELANAVLEPPIPRVIAPLFSLNRLVTVGLLPDAVRRQYGYAWDTVRQQRLRRSMRWLHRIRRLAPNALAVWPQARRLAL